MENKSKVTIHRGSAIKTKARRYKSILTCVVCDGDAHGKIETFPFFFSFQNSNLFSSGYNFDAISCESCKAFFRRNALRPQVKSFRHDIPLEILSISGQIKMSSQWSMFRRFQRTETVQKMSFRKMFSIR